MAAPAEPAGAAAAAADKSTEGASGAAGTAAVDAATSAAEVAASTTGEVAATAASTGTAAVDAATSAAEGAAATTGEAAVTAASTGTAAVDAATSAATGAAATGTAAVDAATSAAMGAAATGTAAVDAATSASTGAAGTIRAKAQGASPSAKALLFPAGSACIKTGMLLQDSLLPAPVSWTETAEKCQQTCQTSKTCNLFSWKADSNPVGGCWLFPERSSPLRQISDPKATSGPKKCLSSKDLEQGPGKAFISQEPSGLGSNTLWLILGGVTVAAALGGMAAFVSTGSKRKSKRGLTVASGDEEMATPIAPSPMFAPPSARAAPGPTPTYQTPGFQPVVYQRLPLPQQTYQVHQVPQAWLRKSCRYRSSRPSIEDDLL